MNFDVVPIACADENWLHDEFFKAHEALVSSSHFGVFYFKADSESEARYVLNRLTTQFQTSGIEFDRKTLSELDPTFGWKFLLGDADTPVFQEVSSSVLVILGSDLLPIWFWQNHLEHISQFTKFRRKKILLSISKQAGEYFDRLNEAEEWLLVPSLSHAKKDRLRELVRSRIELVFAGEPLPEETLERLIDFILGQEPASRWHIEKYLVKLIDKARSSENSDILDLANTCCEVLRPVDPNKWVVPKTVLQVEYQATLDLLFSCRDKFQSVTGLSLFRDNQPLPDPFISSDPFHWFLVIVANLASLFVDAGKRRGLSVIHKFQFDHTSSDVIAIEEPSRFRMTLQSLRTYFLHGLDPGSQDSRKKIESALTWLDLKHFDPSLGQLCGRSGVKKLLVEFSAFVNDANTLISKLEDCPTNYMIGNSIRGEQLTVEEFELGQIISKVVNELGLNLNSSKIAESYGEQIRRELKNSTCDPNNRLVEVEQFVERICIDEARRFPRIGKTLIKFGLQNKEIGKAQDELREIWEQNVSLTEGALVDRAKDIASAIIGKRDSSSQA